MGQYFYKCPKPESSHVDFASYVKSHCEHNATFHGSAFAECPRQPGVKQYPHHVLMYYCNNTKYGNKDCQEAWKQVYGALEMHEQSHAAPSRGAGV